MTVLTILAILLLILIGVTLLRLRVRFEFGRKDRSLFLGLGRSGIEIDYLRQSQTIRVAGLPVKSQPLTRTKSETEGEPPRKPEKAKPNATDQKEASTGFDLNQLRQIRRLAPKVLREVGRYSGKLLNRVIVEKLEADIRAGFDSPDLTGQTYGAYHAVIGAVPVLAGHIRFTPDWQGPSFEGKARGSLALPLYQVVLHTPRLLWRLPLRDIIKMAIGKKKGDQDGQQRG